MQFQILVSNRGLDLTLFAGNFSSEVVQPIIEEAAEYASKQMFVNAPYKTGFLRQNIRTQINPNEATIKSLASYTLFVELGTRPHLIRPVNASVLAFQSGTSGNMVFTKLVHHPGTKPNPFVAKTAMETRDEAGNIAKRVLDEAMGKATSN
jgi:hypothetical protein